MKVEMWFGSRRDKKLLEFEYDDNADIQPLIDFIKKNYEGTKVHVRPTREHDFKDSAGNLYWFKEMMMKPHGKKTFFELVITNRDGKSIPKRRKIFDRYQKSDAFFLDGRHNLESINQEVIDAYMTNLIEQELED